jgi:hypothetical protein
MLGFGEFVIRFVAISCSGGATCSTFPADFGNRYKLKVAASYRLKVEGYRFADVCTR